MRVTLRINAVLLSDAKQLALDRSRTLTETVEDAIRFYIAQEQSKQSFQLHVVEGMGWQPGVNLNSNAAVADLMEQMEGLPP